MQSPQTTEHVKEGDGHLDIHTSVTLRLHGEEVRIDKEIADLVLLFNSYPSIRTSSCCQGGCGSLCSENAYINFSCADGRHLAALMKKCEWYATFHASAGDYRAELKTTDLKWLNDKLFPNSQYRPKKPDPALPRKSTISLKERFTIGGILAILAYGLIGAVWLTAKVIWSLAGFSA